MSSLLPDTPVIAGPDHTRGTVMYTDAEGVHVLDEEGEYRSYPPSQVAVPCANELPAVGAEVLVELGDGWVRGELRDVKTGNAWVSTPSGEHWVPPQCVAYFVTPPPSSATSEGDEAPEPSLDRGARWQRLGHERGWQILLGLGGLAPLLWFANEDEGPAIAAMWLALHAILAIYVHTLDRPLPRFLPAGFGKGDNPGHVGGAELERPPRRGKWEMVMFLITGWFLVGLAPILPGYALAYSALYLAALGLGVAALAYAHDRGSAAAVRRLLSTAPLRDGADSGERRVLGTVTDDRADPAETPLIWREVLLHIWSVTRKVNKQITDSNGNTQTVQADETTTYACGLRHQAQPTRVTLDTTLGPLEVALRGASWASPRELGFGDADSSPGRRWGRRSPEFASLARHTQAHAIERVSGRDRVVVVGELRRDTGGPKLVGGEGGPVLLFAAGKDDPVAVLRGAMLRRRLGLIAMALLGLLTLALVSSPFT